MSMSVYVNVSPATLSMVVSGEILSWFWFSESAPWGEHSSDRHFLSAILGTFGLALVLQWIVGRFWPVRGMNEAIRLGAVLAMAYGCLECPYVSPAPSSIIHFIVHVAHKFALVTLMTFSYWACRKYYEKTY